MRNRRRLAKRVSFLPTKESRRKTKQVQIAATAHVRENFEQMQRAAAAHFSLRKNETDQDISMEEESSEASSEIVYRALR